MSSHFHLPDSFSFAKDNSTVLSLIGKGRDWLSGLLKVSQSLLTSWLGVGRKWDPHPLALNQSFLCDTKNLLKCSCSQLSNNIISLLITIIKKILFKIWGFFFFFCSMYSSLVKLNYITYAKWNNRLFFFFKKGLKNPCVLIANPQWMISIYIFCEEKDKRQELRH